MHCTDVLKSPDGVRCRCKILAEQFPNFQCEGHALSEESPGPVKDGEVLVRFIYTPHHTTSDGHVKPAAFQDAEEKGCSVQREGVGEISAPTHRPQTNIIGVVKATCADLRAIVSDDRARQVGVYATGFAGNPGHADICKTTSKKKITAKILEAFGDTALPWSPRSA
jgi:hypothetical protein